MSDLAGQPPAPLPPRAGPGADRGRRPARLLLLAVCCLGVSAIVTQLVLMRELLCVLAGNEMIFGIILGNWFLLTGLGASLGLSAGRLRRPIAVLVLAQIAIAVLPVAQVFAVRALRNVVFVRGAAVGVTESIVSCFVLLLPYCLITGYLLTLACTLLTSSRTAAGIGRVYFLDVLGDIAGGVLFSFVLVHLLGHFGMVYVPAGLNLAAAVAVSLAARNKALSAVAALAAAAALTLVVTVDLDRLAGQLEYAGQNVIYRGSSPYGQLVVTASAGQYNFIENGLTFFTTHDVETVEETVHYAMVQRPAARRVLLISGGLSGTAREILKYPAAAVDTVELDPLILEVGRRFLPERLADERIAVHAADGRLFVRQSNEHYDVVICDAPDPSTSQINRFYTIEFFEQVRRVLTSDGVVAISLGGYENYLSDELARLISSAHRTLRGVFDHVLILPGRQVIFLASQGPLTADIAGGVERAGVETQWVTREFLDGTLTDDRIAEVNRAAAEDAEVNRDFSPVLYHYHLLYWISQFKVRFGALAAIAAAGLAIYLLRVRAVTFVVFTTGFAAAALEVVLLVAFQIVHGVVYHRVGLIVTVFMAGLAVGAFVANSKLTRWGRRDLTKLALAVAAYAGALPIALLGLNRLTAGGADFVSAAVAFPLLTFVLAVLVGMEFPVAARADFREVAPTAGRLYTADYVGSCVGALLVSTLLIPLVGVLAVCMIVAGLNVASGLIVHFTSGR